MTLAIRRLRVPVQAAILAALIISVPSRVCGQAERPAADVAQTPPPAPGIDAEPGRSVPVLVGGEPVIWIVSGIAQFTPEARAARITERLEEIFHDRSSNQPSPSRTRGSRPNCGARDASS